MSAAVKRLRIIAGPNGSGKTSVYKALLNEGHPNFGIYINADEIEKELATRGIMSFQKYQIKVLESNLKESFSKSKKVRKTSVCSNHFLVKDNFLIIKKKDNIDSYFAGFLADFIRDEMLSHHIERITIETVMSHPSKLDLIKRAERQGYRVYLYYVTTEDPKINIERVWARTQMGGHGVPKETIENRYYRSLQNLFEAMQLSHRAFLIDNSGKVFKLIAEYDKNYNTLKFGEEKCPAWVEEYILSKNSN